MEQQYREMVEYVAENYDPTNLNVEEIGAYPSVDMLAHLFKKPIETIAEDILQTRSYIVCTTQYFNPKKRQRKKVA